MTVLGFGAWRRPLNAVPGKAGLCREIRASTPTGGPVGNGPEAPVGRECLVSSSLCLVGVCSLVPGELPA